MGLETPKLKFFADFIESRLGIVYSDSNYYQLERRLQEIATELGVGTPEKLYEKAKTGIDGVFKDLLLDVATNNETSWFRDASLFKGLEFHVIPTLLKAAPDMKSLRIWSAAASTGQEAYSVAMVLESMKARGVAIPDYQILASDVSERVLKRVLEGAYTQLEVQRGLPAKMLVTHFDKLPDNRWALKADLRKRVRVQRINLLEDWPVLPTFDIVLCRNMLIYQSVANKAKIVKKIHDRVGRGGYLILGATESLLGLQERALFQDENTQGAYFYRRPI